MRDDLVELVRESAAEPLATPDFDAMTARGRRQRTTTRVLGGVASAFVLLVAGVVLWPSTAGSPVISGQPSTSTGTDERVRLPAGWQVLRVGGAVFGVPADWAVETHAGAAHVCPNAAERPTAFLLLGGFEGGVCLTMAQRTLTLEAAPLSALPAAALEPEDGRTWEDVTTAGGVAGQRLVRGENGLVVAYRFPAIDVWLQFSDADRVTTQADVILATLAAAPSDRGPTEEGTPYDADAQMRPDLMVATPDPAAPGATVELTYPEETPRGLGFVLERQLPDGSWDHVYFLIASPADRPDIRPEWFTAEQGAGWDDLGVGGPGSDRVVVPETAEPGPYRLCTANAGDEFCTPLRIEGEPGVPPLPTPAELQAPYEPLFDGLPSPRGDGELVFTDSRVEGLGAFVAAGQPLPFDQPDAVQDAPPGATFTIVVRDADTGEVVAEVASDTPAGAGFEGPTTGPVGTRYVLEGTLRHGDQTTSWADVALVTDLTARVDLALTGVARPGSPVEYVLVNRGPAGVVYGLDYQLDRLVDGSWVRVDAPVVNPVGFPLGPASLSDPLTTSPLPGAGRYRLTTEVTYDQAGDGPAETEDIALEFTTRE